MSSKTWLGRAAFAAGAVCAFGAASCALEMDVDVGQAPDGEVAPYDAEDVGVISAAAVKPGPWGTVAAEEFPKTATAPAYGLGNIKAQLPLLQQNNVGLVLHWPSTELTAATAKARIALVKEAQAKNIEVRPWLLLPEGTTKTTGYFPNSDNYVEFIARAKQLILLWEAQGLKKTTFGVDMELRRDRLDRVLELLAQDETGQVVDLLASYVNRAQFTKATAAYRDFVKWAQARGWKVQVMTLPQVLDDFTIDGDDDLHQAFNTPIRDIPWNTVSFMTFRTLFSGIGGNPLTAFFTRDYAQKAFDQYGKRAGVAIGVTDPGVTSDVPTYTTGTELREDVDAACLAGIPRQRVDVYSLRGIASKAPVAQWFQQPIVTTCNAWGHPTDWTWPQPDLGTPTMETTYQGLDFLLGPKTIFQ